MCFTQDCDWTAEINESSDVIAEKPTRCDECLATIAVGAFVHHIHQQEHEECQDCYAGECACEKNRCCQCESPSYGETFDYDRCEDCHKFLQAIHDVEIEAGCREWESQPLLLSMVESVQEGDKDQAKKYVRKAIQMFPELKVTGYITRIAKRIF
jgi:hypothetical protein